MFTSVQNFYHTENETPKGPPGKAAEAKQAMLPPPPPVTKTKSKWQVSYHKQWRIYDFPHEREQPIVWPVFFFFFFENNVKNAFVPLDPSLAKYSLYKVPQVIPDNRFSVTYFHSIRI